MENRNEIEARNTYTVSAGQLIKEMIIKWLHGFSIEYDGQHERLNLNYRHESGKLIQVRISGNQ